MAMPAPKLPDELLHEILQPVLSVPDEKFTSTEVHSPFSFVSQSSAVILLVCKHWLRVAYPLLYHTVVIRSSAQAQALADALQANKTLGRHVKQLRVEGGYGAAMHKIMSLTPKITDLYLSLMIWSDDSVSGLCRSLSTINPSRVILYDDPFPLKSNSKVRQLAHKIHECIPLWTNLIDFRFPHYRRETSRIHVELIAKALSKARNLKILSSGYHRQPDDLITISQNPSLKTIRMKCSPDELDEPFQEALEKNARFRALVKFDEEPILEPPEKKGPPIIPLSCLTPLNEASNEVQDKIWSKILAFALYIDLGIVYMGDFWQDAIDDWRMTLLLVSKMFYRLALPHYYSHPVIVTPKILRQFSERLVANASLGLHLRSLFVWHDGEGEDHDTQKAVMDIISRAPGLTRVYGVKLGNDGVYISTGVSSLSWEAFCLMAETAGSSLLDFEAISIECEKKLNASDPFYSFTSLRSLVWNCSSKFNVDEGTRLRGCFPSLKFLCIQTCDASFLKLLSHMDLPVLSDFTGSWHRKEMNDILIRHGHKLHVLNSSGFDDLNIYDTCPALRVLSFTSMNAFESSGLRCNKKHMYLEKLIVYSWTRNDMSDDVFATLCITDFPALREIKIEGLFWTTDEREMSKNPWIARAEALLESGVSLTDRRGLPWRPRLKRSKR